MKSRLGIAFLLFVISTLFGAAQSASEAQGVVWPGDGDEAAVSYTSPKSRLGPVVPPAAESSARRFLLDAAEIIME